MGDVRAVPLAVLGAIVAVAVSTRLTRTRLVHAPGTALPGPATPHEPARRASLGAPLPEKAARVATNAARMIHGDVHHTHRAHGHGPHAAKLAWSFDAGGAIEAQITVSPDEQTLYVATLGGSLIALARDGSKKWSLALGGRAYATPCVADDGTIYVGSDAHRFYAVLPDGRVKWKLDTEGDADTGALIAADGKIVFASGPTVVAVRPGGDVAWRFGGKAKVFTSPAQTDEGLVVFGAQDHQVHALAASGAPVWSVDLGADVDGSPAVGDDGSIFVGTDGGEVVRLDGAGEIVWRTSVGGFVRGTLSVARNGDVLAGVYGPMPRVVRIAPDGTIRGAMPIEGTGARELGVHGGPLEDDEGTLFFGAQDDVLYGIAVDGTERWRFLALDDIDAPVTLLADGTLLVGSDDGQVRAFGP